MKKTKFSEQLANSLTRSPIFITYAHLFNNNGNLFLTLIGTIVAVTSLLQVHEVRCLAGLQENECLDQLTIILKLFGFFYFLIAFILGFTVCLTLIEFLFNLGFLIVVSLTRLIIRNIYECNKTFFNKLKINTIVKLIIYINYAAFSKSHKADFTPFELMYYMIIIWFSFFISLIGAKNTTPNVVTILNKIFKHSYSLFEP